MDNPKSAICSYTLPKLQNASLRLFSEDIRITNGWQGGEINCHTGCKAGTSKLIDRAIVGMSKPLMPGLQSGCAMGDECMIHGELATRNGVEPMRGKGAREHVCTTVSLDPAGSGIKRRNTTVGRTHCRDREQLYSSIGDEQHMFEGEMDPFRDDEANSTDPDGLNRRVANAANNTGRNQMKGVEVRFDVTDMYRCPAVREEWDDRRVDGCAHMLVGCSVSNTGKVDLLGMAAPVDTCLEVNGCKQCIVVIIRQFLMKAEVELLNASHVNSLVGVVAPEDVDGGMLAANIATWVSASRR